jgi:hypothetical protein
VLFRSQNTEKRIFVGYAEKGILYRACNFDYLGNVDKKMKYVLILGKNKRETKILRNTREYKIQPYPSKPQNSPPIINKGLTRNRKNPLKDQFLINNYGKMTRNEMASAMGETPRWVKRCLNRLRDQLRPGGSA